MTSSTTSCRRPRWPGSSLASVGFVGYAALEGWSRATTVLGQAPFDIAGAYTLSVVPLFVLMGELASSTGMSSKLFRGTKSMFGTAKGALAYASIGASAGFGAVCGSSVASAATMTRICVPEMQANYYDDRLSTGSVAAGGTLGILIPPSLIFVIYAVISQQSVARLFAAGLVPGLVLTALYILVLAVLVRTFPHWAPRGAYENWQQRLRNILGMWEFVLLVGVSVGGIYAGLFSPTEAAAVGAFMAVVICGLVNRWPLSRNDKAGVFQARSHTRSDNIMLTLALVRQGAGIARVMGLLALPLIRRGELVELLQDQIDPKSVPIHALVLQERHRLPKVRACIDYWAEWLSCQP